MTAAREYWYRGGLEYEVREMVVFEDGGNVFVDCKGAGFVVQESSNKVGASGDKLSPKMPPLVFLVNGLTQQSTDPTIKIVVQ